MTTYDTFTVPVAGGDLHVGRWIGDPGAPTVIALHGITGTHVSWTLVADAVAGNVTLVAPDLRGRGCSNDLPGPYGMAAHADDVIAIADHLGCDALTLAGHSMGGFVSTVTAMRYPERIERVVLVDGGLAVAVPPDVDVDAVLDAVVGPAIARLGMTFASRDEYHDFWRAHPAVGPYWNDAFVAYFDYDLDGEPPALGPRTSLDAVRADGSDTLLVDDARIAVTKVTCPVTMLCAERGMFDEATPLYPDAVIDAVRADAPALTSCARVPNVNHYTILLSSAGADAVANHIVAVTGMQA